MLFALTLSTCPRSSAQPASPAQCRPTLYRCRPVCLYLCHCLCYPEHSRLPLLWRYSLNRWKLCAERGRGGSRVPPPLAEPNRRPREATPCLRKVSRSPGLAGWRRSRMVEEVGPTEANRKVSPRDLTRPLVMTLSAFWMSSTPPLARTKATTWRQLSRRSRRTRSTRSSSHGLRSSEYAARVACRCDNSKARGPECHEAAWLNGSANAQPPEDDRRRVEPGQHCRCAEEGSDEHECESPLPSFSSLLFIYVHSSSLSAELRPRFILS